MKKAAYSYWGFLADIKLDSNYNELSTPDGNAFYSWSIIQELQRRNYNVLTIMPDRDQYAVIKYGKNAFLAWATNKRYNAYDKCDHITYSYMNKSSVFSIWDKYKLNEYDFILHEWRMLIQGRNDLNSKTMTSWQPDYFLQECLLEYCKMHNIRLFIFDLDYKLSIDDIKDMQNVTVLELGNKWKNTQINAKTVYIPFDFSSINEFKPSRIDKRQYDLVYIGNRYERDWCINKYIPETLDKCIIYGNWKESGRDSETKWPLLKFGKRLQLRDMHDAYDSAICTILLAKHDYCKYHFMTARIIEAIFYGCVPLFIREYGDNTIRKFAGACANLLTVKSKSDVINKIDKLKQNQELYSDVLSYLRYRLTKMDVSHFVDILLEDA